MTTRLLALTIVTAMLVLAVGCMKAPVVPPWGTFYTEISAPLDLNSAGGKTIGPKQGKSSSIAVLGLVAVGDAGIKAAAEDGGIIKVNHVDYQFKNVFFGVFSKYTTVVYGE